MKINMGRETILFYLQNNGLSNAVRQCLFLKQMVLGKESTKIWFAENKDKARRKKCIPRQDSLEKQIREMLEWL